MVKSIFLYISSVFLIQDIVARGIELRVSDVMVNALRASPDLSKCPNLTSTAK